MVLIGKRLRQIGNQHAPQVQTTPIVPQNGIGNGCIRKDGALIVVPGKMGHRIEMDWCDIETGEIGGD